MRDARTAIAAIHARGRIAAAGRRHHAVSACPACTDSRRLPQASPALRAELDARAAREGWPALHAELAALDAGRRCAHCAGDATAPPAGAGGVPECRTPDLAVAARHGEPARRLAGALLGARPGAARRAARSGSRSVFNSMMAAGFLDEVRRLRARGDLTARHPSMRAVGYRQLWAHLDGEYGREEAVARALTATRQLAKRQLTWIRGERARGGSILTPIWCRGFETPRPS